jgi:hypothetical protein
LTRYPGTFAGAYLDNAGAVTANVALKVVVAFTADAESHRKELESILPADSMLELRSAAYSHEKLDSVARAIRESQAWYESMGIEVYVVGVDDARNKVLVGISSHNEEAAAALAARFGADQLYIFVSVPPTQDSCIRTACAPPWPGGLNIANSASGTGSHCTSGYSMEATSGNWFMLTAGHCPGDHWYHNGTFMGATPAGKNAFINNSNADVQAYDVAQRNQSNIVLTGTKTCNPCSFRTMTARQNVTDDMVGDTTCASGAYSGSDCGVLKDYDFAYYYADYEKWLLNQRVADYIRTMGDSGAPVFRGTLALGSHVNYHMTLAGRSIRMSGLRSSDSAW